jgi:hypothetical protein
MMPPQRDEKESLDLGTVLVDREKCLVELLE